MRRSSVIQVEGKKLSKISLKIYTEKIVFSF